MVPIFYPGVSKNVDDFINQVKYLNKIDWLTNNINKNVIHAFITHNEGFFPQVMTRADGRHELAILATRIKSQFQSSEELQSKLGKISTATIQHLPIQLWQLIVDKTITTPVEVRQADIQKRTSKAWNKMVKEAQVNFINQNRIPLSELSFTNYDYNLILKFLKRMNKEVKSQEGMDKEKQTHITCLNVNEDTTAHFLDIARHIDDLLISCPHTNSLIFGSTGLNMLADFGFVNDPTKISAQADKLKNFDFEVNVFTFKNLQDLSRLIVLYPSARIRIGQQGNFAANAQAAQEILKQLKDGEYVICPQKGHPGIYDVSYKVENTYSMTIGPANDLQACASVLINREINPKIWFNHPEMSLAALHFSHQELIDFLTRQPVPNRVLNIAGLEDYVGRIRNDPMYQPYGIQNGVILWDIYLKELLRCSRPELQTLHANAIVVLHITENISTVLRDSGCNQLSILKIEGITTFWPVRYFIRLANIKKDFPQLKIELPKRGHFVSSSGEAAGLLNSPNIPNESYAVWPSKSTPRAYGLFFKINGKLNDHPILINPSALTDEISKDLLSCMLKYIQIANARSHA